MSINKPCECFKCLKPLRDIGEKDKYLQPLDGLAFETHGHYGTTFFDPCDGTKLEIVICDECLKEYFGVPYL